MAKANDISARATPDLITGKKSVGRTPKPGALTVAQRQAKFRAERVQVKLGETMAATVTELASEFDMTIDEVMQSLLRFALCNRNWRQTGF